MYLEKILSNVNEFEIVGKAKNGKELLDLILDKKPDLVITDVDMPEFSGVQVAEKTSKLGIPLKYIFITGNSECIMDSKLKSLSVDRVIKKPIMDDEKFIEQIKLSLKLRKHLEEIVIGQENKEKVLKNTKKESNIVKLFKKIFTSK